MNRGCLAQRSSDFLWFNLFIMLLRITIPVVKSDVIDRILFLDAHSCLGWTVQVAVVSTTWLMRKRGSGLLFLGVRVFSEKWGKQNGVRVRDCSHSLAQIADRGLQAQGSRGDTSVIVVLWRCAFARNGSLLSKFCWPSTRFNSNRDGYGGGTASNIHGTCTVDEGWHKGLHLLFLQTALSLR